MPTPGGRLMWRFALISLLIGLVVPTSGLALECGQANTTPLAAIRGVHAPAIAEGQTVWVEAVVSASFPGQEALNGFYLQALDQSAGLFVYAPEISVEQAPRRGQRVIVEARTGRYRGHVQLEQMRAHRVCGNAAPVPITLDASRPDDFAGLHDQLVRLVAPLSVSDVYNLGRYGSLRIAVGARAFQPTTGVSGGVLSSIVLDDGRYQRNPRPVPYLNAQGVRRAGDQIESVTGVLTRAFGQWRIHPVEPVVFRTANPRAAAPAQQGDWRAVNFNLRNYFIDVGGRGADTAAAFARQRDRLNATLSALDADLLALHEVQNNPDAVADLIARLNRDQPTPKHYRAALPARQPAAIRSVLLYRPAVFTKQRAAALSAPIHPRDPVVASFRTANGQVIHAISVHFKSRGGCPQSGDINQGEGCWAERRNQQSKTLQADLQKWLGVSELADKPILLLADLNAYAAEQAVTQWRASGFSDLIADHLPGGRRVTYVYRGKAGYLDHALASKQLAQSIAQVAIWSVNADEPAYQAEQGEGVWRASDHDPIIIDGYGVARH